MTRCFFQNFSAFAVNISMIDMLFKRESSLTQKLSQKRWNSLRYAVQHCPHDSTKSRVTMRDPYLLCMFYVIHKIPISY